jgi:hypothetical protein
MLGTIHKITLTDFQDFGPPPLSSLGMIEWHPLSDGPFRRRHSFMDGHYFPFLAWDDISRISVDIRKVYHSCFEPKPSHYPERFSSDVGA